MDPSQCPDPMNECLVATCDMGVCGTTPVPDGTPTNSGQFVGDCKLQVCDGVGNAKIVDDNDPTDDLNDCTAETCSGGQQGSTPIAGPCAQNGGTICADPAGPKAGQCVECNVDADCAMPGYVCDPAGGTNTCVALMCSDGVMNGMETDVDCGGSDCADCGNMQACQTGSDCQSGFCDAFVCGACSSNTHCLTTQHCDLALNGGTCVEDFANGIACSDPNGCLSGHCIDGVCCDTACAGTCQACNVIGHGGICTDVPYGSDPANECAGAEVCCAGACVLAACPGGSFGFPRAIRNDFPGELVDVNGDGVMDVVGMYGLGNLHVRIGNGNGTFVYTNYAISSNFELLGVTDVNADGLPDIEVYAQSGSTIGVLLNQGNGTFAPKVNYPINGSSYSYGVSMVDLNGDGNPDFAVNNGWNTSVLMNNGNGTFAPQIDYSLRLWTITDLNGDGRADMVGTAFDGQNDVIRVLLNSGNGTFAPPTDYLAPMSFKDLTLADLNGDGKPDMVENTYTLVRVLMNNGNGTFASGVDHTVGYAPDPSMTAADLNGDGKLDLIRAGDFAKLWVLLNNGNGTFAPPAPYLHAVNQAYINTSIVKVADMNGDMAPDLVIKRWAADGPNVEYVGVEVLWNDGTGGFGTHWAHSWWSGPVAGQRDHVSIAVGDLDVDGKLDLAVAREALPPNPSLTLFKNDGNATFSVIGDYSAGNGPLNVADWTDDGKPDLVIGYNVLPNDGDGTITTKLSSSVDSGNLLDPGPMVSADFNGDGSPDLAVGYNSFDNDKLICHGRVRVLSNHGNGAFNSLLAYSTFTGCPNGMATADFNGDGKPDLAVTWNWDMPTLLLSNGNGSFTAIQVFPGPGFVAFPNTMAAADFDGDGKPDLVIGSIDNQPKVRVLHNTGNGTFVPGMDYFVNPKALTAADVNGDGKPDLEFLDSNTMNVLMNNGDGTFAGPANYPLNNAATSLEVADLDGDGFADIAVSGDAANSLSIFLNGGNGTFASRVDHPYAGRPIRAADFNGDGTTDLALGEGYLLLNGGNGSFAPLAFGLNTALSTIAADLNGDGKLDLAALETAYIQLPEAYTNSSIYVSARINTCLP